MEKLYTDVVSLFSSRGQLRPWLVENVNTVLAVPLLLVLEAILLYKFNLSAGAIAGTAAIFFFLSFTMLCYAWSIGRELSQTARTAAWNYRMEEHRGYTNKMGISLLLGVVAIECAIRKEGGLWGPFWLMLSHFAFVSIATVSYLIARFVLTGLKSPDRHKVWVRILGLSYGITLITGTTLILIKFPPT